MRVICTTVIRGADNFDMSGRIMEIDLPTGEVVFSMNLPHNKGSVLGPRGGSRGGRGVRVFENSIYLAIYDRVLVYDLEWNLLTEIRHPHVVGHHEIQVDHEGIWCCSTVADAVMKLGFKGNVLFEWWASEDEAFVSWTGAKKIRWDRRIDYSTYLDASGEEKHPSKQFHLNSIYCVDGKVYVYDSNYQVLFAVWPKFEPLIRNIEWDHAHNVCLRGQDILVNVSARKAFEIWRMPTAVERFWRKNPYLVQRVIVVPGEDKSTQFSNSGWIRGRIDLESNEFIVGCNPASLHYIRNGEVVRTWEISRNVNEAIHGLTLKQSDKPPRYQLEARCGAALGTPSMHIPRW
jgi:hypothetical protein